MTHARTQHGHRNHRLIAVAAGALLLLSASGCQTPTSSQNRKAAHDRWALARAGVMYSMAKQQFEVGDLDKADATVNQALSSKPDEPRFYELSARISIERGELEQAFHKLEMARGFDENRPETHYLLGMVYQRWQKHDAALASYTRSYELKPDDVSPLLAASEMLVKLRRQDEAIALLNSKMVYFAHNAAIRVALGRTHALNRNYATAARLFREAHVLAPEDVTIVEFLAMALHADGQHAEAVGYLTRLREHEAYRDRADIDLALGDCFVATGRTGEARKLFIEMTQRDENDVTAWIKLGQVAWAVGDRPRAAESARRTMALAPQRHEGYLLQGMIAMKAERHAEAIRMFNHAGTLAPRDAAPLILKGMTLERVGDTRGAIAAYQEALRVDPSDDRAKKLLTAVAE